MSTERQERIVENLAVAASIGIISLIVSAVAMLCEAGESSRERAVLQQLAGRAVSASPSPVFDPAFARIHTMGSGRTALYGAFLAFRSRSGIAIAAAIFSREGELETIRLLDASSLRAPFAREDWFVDFLGRGGQTPFPRSGAASRSPEAVSGASESFVGTGAVLERASDAVRRVAEAGT
jgi:hypothetical protein